MEKLEWYDQAACVKHPDVDWFPDRGEDYKTAVAICMGECAVQERCLEENLSQRFGVWGGATSKERTRIRSARLRLRVLDN